MLPPAELRGRRSAGGEDRFLVAFAEAALGLGDLPPGTAERTVARLREFLERVPPGVRRSFETAVFFMPPGFFDRGWFERQDLETRSRHLEALLARHEGSDPGALVDEAALLNLVKSLLAACFCELPEARARMRHDPVPAALPRRADGSEVVPPTGRDLRPGRSPTGRGLIDRATPLARLPRSFPEGRTVAVVGSGAGGLAAAHALLERDEARGLNVVVLEAGPLVVNDGFPERPLDAYASLYVNAGATPSRSLRWNFIQGRCVGGSTTVNNAGCIAPEGPWWDRLVRTWEEAAGTGLDWDGLRSAFRELAGPLEVAPVEDHVITRAARTAFEGFAGLHPDITDAGKLPANLRDCIGCGQCNSGCRYDAKRAPLVALLPEILDRGGVLVPEATVRALDLRGRPGDRTAVGLEIDDRSGERHYLEVDEVILAGSAYASSHLLFRSGFTGYDRGTHTVGKGFSCNYASAVLGRFDAPQDGGRGQQLAFHVDLPRHGIIIETAFAPPTVYAMLSNQWGQRLQRMIDAYDHVAVAFPTISSDARGEITWPLLQDPAIEFELSPTDWGRLAFGMRLCAEALRRKGAREISDSRFSGRTAVMTGDEAEDRRRLDAFYADLGPETFLKMQTAHLQGGNVIHADPMRGVVDADLRVHGIDNVHVMDASVIPAPITLNIQYTVMALARRAARAMRL